MEELIQKLAVDEVVFAYSDVPHDYVMHLASRAMAAGASFRLMGPKETMLKAKVPVISVCAVRTGCGKSQTSRRVVQILRKKGRRVVSIRHPMPYGDLAEQAVERFASYEDMARYKCTIEEREEYEPHVAMGAVVFAGVDYAKILEQAQKEADVILWDGGNNDFGFYESTLEIAIVDPLRPGHELAYHPGETVLRRAHVVIVNKIKQARPEAVEQVLANIEAVNPKATVIRAASPVAVADRSAIERKRVIVVEDGPTLTHGGMDIGAGWVAAQELRATVVSPRKYAVGSIRATYEKYRQTQKVLPAMGYSEQQLADLTETIENTVQAEKVDAILSATPIDLGKIVRAPVPIIRASYELEEIGTPNLEGVLVRF
jgi:predicted GTPase